MSMLAYLEEHYAFENSALAESRYQTYLEQNNFITIKKPYGFVVYKFEGDACIVQDIYTTPEARKQGKAWNLFRIIRDEIRQHSACSVVIGFIEHGPVKSNKDSEGWMAAAGFKPVYELKNRTVYMRGIE